MRLLLLLPSLPPAALAAALAAGLSPASALAQADAGSPSCVVRVVEPADGASDLRDDAMNPLVLRFEVSEACPDPLPAPAPTLRDPNGALVSLDFTRAGTELTARPLGYLVDGLFEIDPGSRTDECTSKPARVTTFRIGPGPDVRLVVFTPHDKYTSGSELESLEIFLSEPLDLDALGAIERNVTVSGLEPSDIYYMKDTASILWSWQRIAGGLPPTTTEKVTVRVRQGLVFASGLPMATDFELSVRPKDYLVHGWWPGAKACAEPADPYPDNPDPGGGQSFACSAGSGSPLAAAAALLLPPLLARLALRRRRP